MRTLPIYTFALGLLFGATLCSYLSHAGTGSDDYWLGYQDRELHNNYGSADPYYPSYQYNQKPQPFSERKPC